MKTLAQMEGQYRGLLEAAPDGMVVVNQDGEIVLLNLQAERQFGYSRDELIGQQVKRIIPEGFAERLIADGARSVAEALAQRIGMGIDLWGRRKNGKEFAIEIMLSPLESPEGGLVAAAIRDISGRSAAEEHLAEMERKHRFVEDALRESEERYRVLLDGIRDYAIFMMDPQGRVISWNAGAERIKGYKADQIVGQSFSCFFLPEDIRRGRPEEVLRLTAENGQHQEQATRVRRDGSRFLASITFTALRDPAGNLLGFSEFSHDLSESKASGAKYRGLLEAAPDAMVVVNQSGEIVLLNVQAEKQFGYSRDELVGQQVRNIIPVGFAERLIADGTRSAAEALAQQIGMGIELSGRRKDGSQFPIEIMLSPLESAEGILVTAAIRDISVRKAAEKHLAQMEGRYRGLLEAAPDAMVVVNQHGEIVLLNVQAEKQFGYSRDELVGQQVRNIIPEGFAERLIADGTRSAAEALAQQIGMGIELSGRRKDGSRFPIEIMLSPLESVEGILVTAAIRDISVRKAAEEHLRQSEELLRLTVSSVKDYAIFMLDPLGRIATWNEGAEMLKGYRPNEILGRHFSCFYPAEDIKSGKPEFELKEAALTGHIEDTGFRLRKDGSRYLADVVITALHDGEGRLRGFGKIIHDITDRKEAENNLAQMTRELTLKNQLLGSVVEGTTDPIYVRDLENRFLLANSACAGLFGRSVIQVLGTSMRELLPNDSYYAVAQSDREVVLAGDTRTVEEVAEIDGIVRIFLTTKGPYRDADQKTIGTMGVARDITERKRSEERLVKTARELKRSNDELQQFAYVASHDLQEPLRMVASFTELLAKRYKGRLDSDADEFIDFAVDGCNRMQGLIRDLLAYSRAGASGKSLHRCPSEDALNNALVNLRAAIEESGAVVTHDPLPAIWTDDKQLTQVFQNLIGNAVKYRSAEVPCVHISATKNQSGEWIFSVRDNGLGIDPRYFERIFILFQRLHGQTEFEGTGIGLAICRKIVERLGGRIWVESEAGKGSTFHFALPETPQAAESGAPGERDLAEKEAKR